ncbi:MAG: glycosyltransferase family 4 protein [Opitutaceae bacterium]
MMHFGFVEKGYPGPAGGGGAGTFVQVMGRHLVKEGHRVTVVATSRDRQRMEENDEGVRVVRLPVGRDRMMKIFALPGAYAFRHMARHLCRGWMVAREIDRLNADRPFDLVEYSEGGDYWHGRRRRFKLVSHLHGSRYTFLKQSGRPVDAAEWRQRKLELSFIRSADWVFSPSRALAGIVEEEAACRLTHLTIQPYPLDAESASEAVRSSRTSGEMKVIFAARNDPVKGGDVLLSSVNHVEASGGGILFDFYGYAPKPGQLLPRSVRVHGFVPRKTLLDCYKEADVAVIPSFWDNSPNTIYEAMAAGLPVIGSSVGGIPELVSHGETGFLVEARDFRGIAARLLEFRDNPQMRIFMGAAARERIMHLANPEANLQARLAVYESIVSTNPVRPLVTEP